MSRVSVTDWRPMRDMPEGNYYRVVGNVVELEIAGTDLRITVPLSAVRGMVGEETLLHGKEEG